MEEGKKIRIVFMGTPEFAVGSLKALVENGYNVVGVVTVPDKPSGRGLKLNTSAVKEYALQVGIPILQPVSLKDPSFIEELERWRGDCFVVVAFRMLPQIVWAMPRLGTFNLHASLLPKYRGAAPINWAIIRGETKTGVTTFLLDKEIDTGQILFQQECDILPEDNIGSLYDKLMGMGSKLVLKTVDSLSEGSTSPTPQIVDSEIYPAPKITRETCRIGWDRSSTEVSNLVRGLSPYPAAYSTLVSSEKRIDLKIYSGRSDSEDKSNGDIGCIISDGKSYLGVKCSKGVYMVTELQMAGKKRLPVREFLAGIHDISKFHFE